MTRERGDHTIIAFACPWRVPIDRRVDRDRPEVSALAMNTSAFRRTSG
jgi:hypothetical protein